MKSLANSLSAAILLAALAAGPAARAGDSLLVPREDGRWDPALRRAAGSIRDGDFRSAIQILQGILDDGASGRFLREVPPRPGPEGLLIDEDSGSEDQSAAARPAARDERDPDEPLGPGDDSGEAGAPDEEELPQDNDPAPVPQVRRDPRRNDPAPRSAQLHVSVAEVARDLLAALPPEGVKTYRRLYDPLAERAFREALRSRDPDLLRAVADKYPISSVSGEALDRLAEVLLEDGRPWSALAVWCGLLEGRSDPPAAHFESEMKLLAALRLAGAGEAYGEARERCIARLRTLGGSDGLQDGARLLKALEDVEKVHPLRSAWAATALDPAGPAGPLPRMGSRDLAFAWSSPFWSDARATLPQPPDRALLGRFQIRNPIFDPPLWFPYFPSVLSEGGRDSIFVNGTFRLHRIAAAGGKVERIYEKPFAGRDVATFQERTESPVSCVSLAEAPAPPSAGGGGTAGEVVLAGFISSRVRSRSYQYYEITAEMPTRSLAALDAPSGRLLWHTGDLVLGAAGKPVSFVTPALRRGRRAYAFGWQQDGYINGVLCALDLQSGEILWSQLLVSNQIELTMFGEMGREPFASILAEREGVIYCVTNLGVVAAVDADTGRILWLTTYDSIPVESGEGLRSPFREIVWGVNPPLVAGDTLLVTPRDSHFLYALDLGAGVPRQGRRAGRVLWTWSNRGRALRDLLGVREGILYFTGPGGVQALDLRPTAEGGAPRSIPSPLPWAGWGIDGRGALAAEGVVLAALEPVGSRIPGEPRALQGRLWLVDFALRERTALSEPFQKHGLTGPEDWRSRGVLPFAGNVTVAGGRVLVTSERIVACFTARIPGAAAATADRRTVPPPPAGPPVPERAR